MENYANALILSIVQGVTEFLPVSSSGHLILVGELLDFVGEKAASFMVAIQLGSILAVVVLYWSRFKGLVCPKSPVGFSGVRGIMLLMLTAMPACIVGLLAHSFIKTYLLTPSAVCLALIVGALCMLFAEKRKVMIKYCNLDELTPRLALGVGLFQCLALWPGFSRSGATIMGGMLLGARRGLAAEYSFMAAVPIMAAATSYDLMKSWHLLSITDVPFFAFGIGASFIAALVAVKVFVALVGRITLIPFAMYRLILAPVVFYFMVY